MKTYPPTGTCYWCDMLLPDERLALPLPGRYFCSDEHEQEYKRKHPKRYKAICEQGKTAPPVHTN